MPREGHDKWELVSERVDRFLIPVAVGACCMLILTQLITNVPSVRKTVDAVSGRFISASSNHLPASIRTESAQLQLYLSPSEPRPDITVLVNNQPVATFTQSTLSITVHEGDTLSVEETQPGLVMVQISHMNPNLLTPSTGQILNIAEPNQPSDEMVVRFLQ